MRIFSNSLLAFFLILLLTVHFFQLVVITFPVPKMIERAFAQEIEYAYIGSVPEHVRQVFQIPPLYEPSLEVTHSSFFDRAMLKSFEFRKEKLFSDSDEHEFYLNTMDFGAQVIGIQAASEYYFAKPVQELAFEESLALAGFHKIFMK